MPLSNSTLFHEKKTTAAAATAKSLQWCPTLCDPIDGSPPGSPVPGILQTRTLEWVAISFSNAWKWKVKVKLLSHVWLLATPWTAAYQAPPSMGFSRQEYWSGVPYTRQVDLQLWNEVTNFPLDAERSSLGERQFVLFCSKVWSKGRLGYGTRKQFKIGSGDIHKE